MYVLLIYTHHITIIDVVSARVDLDIISSPNMHTDKTHMWVACESSL